MAIKIVRSTIAKTKRAKFTFFSDPQPRYGMILLHGLGDSAESSGWQQTCQDLVGEFPDLKIILPSAPARKVTLLGGQVSNAWFDIVGLDPRSADSADGIDQGFAEVLMLVDELVASGISEDQVIISGFSQGGALALYSGLQTQKMKINSVVSISGYLPRPSKFRVSEVCKKVNVLMQHGTRDHTVPFHFGKLSAEALTNQGIKLEFKDYPVEHTFSSEMLRDLKVFLRNQLNSSNCIRSIPLKKKNSSWARQAEAVPFNHLGIFYAGQEALLKNLQNQSLNGTRVIIQEYNASKDRYVVQYSTGDEPATVVSVSLSKLAIIVHGFKRSDNKPIRISGIEDDEYLSDQGRISIDDVRLPVNTVVFGRGYTGNPELNGAWGLIISDKYNGADKYLINFGKNSPIASKWNRVQCIPPFP